MNELNLINHNIYYLFLCFTVYAFLGWVLETVYATIKKRCFINRGFLNGPFCPIYGFGTIVLITFLKPFMNNVFALFIFSIILTSLLEYLTGYILETLFHSSWWDYNNRKYNIKGRICLEFSIYWGLLSIFILKIIHPTLDFIIKWIPFPIGTWIFSALLAYFIADFTASLIEVIHMHSLFKELHNINLEIKERLENLNSHIKSLRRNKQIDANSEDLIAELKTRYEYIISKAIKRSSRIRNAFPEFKSKRFNGVLNDIMEKIHGKK